MAIRSTRPNSTQKKIVARQDAYANVTLLLIEGRRGKVFYPMGRRGYGKSKEDGTLKSRKGGKAV